MTKQTQVPMQTHGPRVHRQQAMYMLQSRTKMRPPRKAPFQRQEIQAVACSRTRKCTQGRGSQAAKRCQCTVEAGSLLPLKC